jgi:hypothetical protein
MGLLSMITDPLARRAMHSFLIIPAATLCLVVTQGAARVQDGPKLHDIPAFFVKGSAVELDPELLKHRLSLKEIEAAKLNGESPDVKDVLGWMAKYEKLEIRIDEPFEVRGNIPVYLPPNSMGDEAYTTCFVAFTYNGLVLRAVGSELELVRPETRPGLERPSRPWDRQNVLATRLYHLGYLKPDPIMKHYREQIGTPEGHAVLQPKSNVLIVIDSARALMGLQDYIDSETLEAMGVSATRGHGAGEEPRPPALGAISSRESIHFYLMALARWNQIPLLAAEKKGSHERYYPEADLWTTERGYRTLQSEYRRIQEFVRLAQSTGGEGWEDPSPHRTLQPIEQRQFEIRFGVIRQQPLGGSSTKNKKAGRKRS